MKEIYNYLEKTLLSIIFILAFALPSFASCAEKPEPKEPDPPIVNPADTTSEEENPVVIPGEVPLLNKGVNFTGWFEYIQSANDIHFGKMGKEDFENVKKLGISTVRLPVDFYSMTKSSPGYIVPPLLFTMLDQVISWAEEQQLYIILDNHAGSQPKLSVSETTAFLTALWSQLAPHFKDRSKYLILEIMNEPCGDALKNTWGNIQGEIINLIRKYDTEHYLIVGGSEWNSYTQLSSLPNYSDPRLIYTFHFYEPFVFTHQGASWSNMLDVGGIPFPYNSSDIPSKYSGYASNGTVEIVKKMLDVAIRFKQERNVPLFCGEFGVYKEKAPDESRIFWHQIVSSYLTDNGIFWSLWTYNNGGFSIFNKGSNELFDHDLDVKLLEALGLTIPPQTPYISEADTKGMVLFYDYLPRFLSNESYLNDGKSDFYCEESPYEGKYCIKWTIGEQYSTITFKFSPMRDFSILKQDNHLFQCKMKVSEGFSGLQLRFLNPSDPFPWRLAYEIAGDEIPSDGLWHTISIPLPSFLDIGGWKEEWKGGNGEATWAKIDKFEFSDEKAQKGINVWLDQIEII